jgi:phage tail-like protein
MTLENASYPLHTFRFRVEFAEEPLGPAGAGAPVPLCAGAFSECSGLEATMEPKVINEGGRNYGANQRSGRVTFSTVILRRGLTNSRDLWRWFELLTNRHAYSYRLSAEIKVFGPSAVSSAADETAEPVLTWRLARALPIKFRTADLNARSAAEVGVEELHLAHEGLTLV